MAEQVRKSRMQEALEDAGYECQSYSGRGMFGKTCLSFMCVEYQTPMKALADALVSIMEDGAEIDDAALTFAEQMRGMVTDSLGLGTVCYFPNLPYVED